MVLEIDYFVLPFSYDQRCPFLLPSGWLLGRNMFQPLTLEMTGLSAYTVHRLNSYATFLLQLGI